MTESAGGLSAALVAALGELSDTPKSGSVRMSGRPDRSYPTLSDVHGITRPVLCRHGLAAVQDVVVDGDWVSVSTHVVHVSGEERSFGPIRFPAGRDAQTTGSQVTYARRYGLMAALGLAGKDEDDDGQQTVADRGSAVSSHPLTPSTPSKSDGTSRGSGVPSGSTQARQAKASAAAITKAEEWRARVKELPSGEVRARASKVFTDAGAQPGVALSPEQAVVILGGLKKYEPRIVMSEMLRDNPPPELFDDGPPLDDENVPVDD